MRMGNLLGALGGLSGGTVKGGRGGIQLSGICIFHRLLKVCQTSSGQTELQFFCILSPATRYIEVSLLFTDANT